MKSYMKLLVSLLVAVALLTGLFALPQTALAASAVSGQSNSVLGDASGDGKINLKDAIMTLQVSNGKEVDIDSDAADVSGDDKVNLKDAILNVNGKVTVSGGSVTSNARAEIERKTGSHIFA